MEAIIKAEFKKLLTVRSTYVITLLIIFLSGFFTYIGTSKTFDFSNCPPPTSNSSIQKACPPPKITKNLPRDKVLTNIEETVMGSSTLIAIVVVLFMAHEYRYNTITYTLTFTKSRSRVLAAKVLVGAAFVIVLTIVSIAVTVASTHLAVSAKGLHLLPQDISWTSILSRALFFNLGFSLFGLGVITLVRNLTAGLVTLFVLPTLDQLLGSLLKNNIEPTKIMPFSALNRIIDHGNHGATPTSYVSVTSAALLFTAYLIAFWLINWYLFLRRDAT